MFIVVHERGRRPASNLYPRYESPPLLSLHHPDRVTITQSSGNPTLGPTASAHSAELAGCA